MGDRFPGTVTSARPPEDRLDSWKEIASYLKRDVTTVQRWEKREAMPVHRHLHEKTGSVFAYRAELDAWARGRNLRLGQESENGVPSPIAAVPPSRLEKPVTPDQMEIHLARGGAGSRAGDLRNDLVSENGAFLAKPSHRCPISNSHGLRWFGAGRSRVTRRSFCRISFQPGRTDGCLGHASGIGTVSQLDPWQRSGARQSVDTQSWVLTRWLFGHVLDAQAGRLRY